MSKTELSHETEASPELSQVKAERDFLVDYVRLDRDYCDAFYDYLDQHRAECTAVVYGDGKEVWAQVELASGVQLLVNTKTVDFTIDNGETISGCAQWYSGLRRWLFGQPLWQKALIEGIKQAARRVHDAD